MNMQKKKILILLIILFFLSNCVNYRINVNTIPGDEVEVFIDGVPKGKNNNNGELSFEYNRISPLKSPVVYVKKDDYEGWFKCDVINYKPTYKNVCNFDIDNSNKGVKNIEITFLTYSSHYIDIKDRCSLEDVNNYKRDYKFNFPQKPVARTVIGATFITVGFAANIIAAACFSYSEKYERTDYSSSLMFGDLYQFFGRLGVIIGITSSGLGTAFILGSTHKWKNYYEWQESQDIMDTKLPTQINIVVTKDF